LHAIGSPHRSASAIERSYWVSHESFTSLLETVVAVTPSCLPVGITFDDGNESDATIALPELVKRGLNATFFVVASRIGLAHYLDRKALADLVSAGMEIGNHGMHHSDWRKIDDATLRLEIVDGRHRIEDISGAALTKAAIPFGSYDRRVLKRLRSESFECVYTSDGGLARADAWLKPRQTISGDMSDACVKRLITEYPSLWLRLQRGTATISKKLR
jgi:peptidoglycan/xylan/chitin deacetylase (PgdA/CDA1 family)